MHIYRFFSTFLVDTFRLGLREKLLLQVSQTYLPTFLGIIPRAWQLACDWRLATGFEPVSEWLCFERLFSTGSFLFTYLAQLAAFSCFCIQQYSSRLTQLSFLFEK
jgi:hypothetical protein